MPLFKEQPSLKTALFEKLFLKKVLCEEELVSFTVMFADEITINPTAVV
jgi:hypothetical protein